MQNSVAFLNTTYEEALELAREARDYLGIQDSSERDELEPLTKLAASCEFMRLTTRLSHVIAWLLVQRAVQAGEITREEAVKPHHRLGGHKVCSGNESAEGLPPRLSALLERSLSLYERVARLDAMLGSGGS